MPRIDDPSGGGLRSARRQAREAATATPLNRTSIGRGGLRVHSGGVITIENGGLSITGSAEIIGEMIGSGALTWSGPVTITGNVGMTGDVDMTGTVTVSGPLNIIGPVDITDDLDITGNTTITGTMSIEGATTLKDDLTLTGGGKIHAGDLTVEPVLYGGSIAFASGGYLSGAGGAQLTGPAGTTFVAAYASMAAMQAGGISLRTTTTRNESHGNFHVIGDYSGSGAKTFRINHPTKPGRLLLHGSTESPVSGIEYWGEGELDAGGRGEIVLPDYFDALAKAEGRMALVTGRGFAADWSDIDVDKFTVTGKPHGKFSWLVKAERIGGDFELEPLGEEAEGPQSNSGQ